MKTRIEAIAEKFNLFTLDNLPATHLPHFNERLKGKDFQVNEFMQNFTGCESGIFYECRKDTDYTGKVNYYIEFVYPLYLPSGSDILLMLQTDRGGKMYFYPYYSHMHKYHGISHYKKSYALKGLQEPNRIGVFTTNKVNAHFEYCKNYIDILDNLCNQVNDENAEHQQKINDFINDILSPSDADD